MGLDMYFKADKYVSSYKFDKKEEKDTHQLIVKAVGTEKLVSPDSPGVNVSTTVAYWRKANAIHSWFVNNLADGVDDCKPVYVPEEKIEELVEACQSALKLYKEGKTEEAGKLMEPMPGFFFGSYEINEYWAEDIESTIKQLTPLLNLEDTFDFYYQASW